MSYTGDWDIFVDGVEISVGVVDFDLRAGSLGFVVPDPDGTVAYPALSGGEVITWSGGGTFTLSAGTFDTVFNGGTATYSSVGGDVIFTTLPIPEPSAALLGAAVLLSLRRSRGRQ